MNLRSIFVASLFAFGAGTLGAELPEGVAGDGKFTRYEEDESGSRLQTGIGSYRNKDGVIVDLIGAIHIADKVYYDKLNRRFTRYDAMLYEMVGESYQRRMQWKSAHKRGEATETLAPDDSELIAEEMKEKAAGGNLAWLHPLYETMEKTLGLTGQMNGIDYSRENFVHADMTLRAFTAMQQEKNESFLTLWWKSIVAQTLHPEAAPEQPGLLKIMESLCRQDGSTGLRRIAARTFGSMEGALSGLESDGGTVILTERNKVALNVLDQQIKLGKRNLAIFYGAAHLADMDA
ncbi:MAG: hypothetical protein K8R87_04015, partial [Verrucomicrobia bacterium]|nr:hypothetical protein [Verrucomicrobiota bacterium]